MRPFFPPPSGIAHLYVGPVMHARLKPLGHRFSYDVASLLVDIDRLDDLPRLSRLIRTTASISSRCTTAISAPPTARRRQAMRRASSRMPGSTSRAGACLLLTYPRILGYVFNPLSIYWRYDRQGELRAVIYEVRNTFGERHSYVAPVRAGELGPEGLKQSRDKRFHVSPFLGMAMRYHFRLRPPGETIALRILETDSEGPILSATFKGRRIGLTSAALLKTFMRLPFLTAKIVAGIHWEALKLWLKGARYHPKPAPPVAASFGDATTEDARQGIPLRWGTMR